MRTRLLCISTLLVTLLSTSTALADDVKIIVPVKLTWIHTDITEGAVHCRVWAINPKGGENEVGRGDARFTLVDSFKGRGRGGRTPVKAFDGEVAVAITLDKVKSSGSELSRFECYLQLLVPTDDRTRFPGGFTFRHIPQLVAEYPLSSRANQTYEVSGAFVRESGEGSKEGADSKSGAKKATSKPKSK